MKNFALLGAAGFVAPRHMAAIKETGNKLIAACDLHDSVGILDNYFPEAAFFTEIERFDRHLEKLRRISYDTRTHYVSICSPNYLHDAHIRLALRLNAHAISEKPLVISPWNLKLLEQLEAESGCRVFTILQLRMHPTILALRNSVNDLTKGKRPEIDLTYITRRGIWYHHSWKGNEEKSGGIAMNIGVHFFDFLIWLFGSVESAKIHLRQRDKMAGVMELERARVRWFLSIDEKDLPEKQSAQGQYAYRSIRIDENEVAFTSGFTDLHTQMYESILAGNGYGIRDAEPAIAFVQSMRTMDISSVNGDAHPLLKI